MTVTEIMTDKKTTYKPTKNKADVFRYLEASGWDIGKSQFYDHVKSGKLSPNKKSGQFTRKAVDKYAKDFLRRAETGKKVSEEISELQRQIQEEDLAAKKFKREREEFKLKKEKGEFFLFEDFEREVAARAVVLDSSYERQVRDESRAAIHLVGGDIKKAPELEVFLVEKFHELLNEFATTKRFHVLVSPVEED